ncbi:hypothetical protein [Streptomyces albidoflavus]|uniref:hypothetical protein n=1 Tax=Streptomyces albidoflavus TaxID=1886 RepID=UPI0033D1347A
MRSARRFFRSVESLVGGLGNEVGHGLRGHEVEGLLLIQAGPLGGDGDNVGEHTLHGGRLDFHAPGQQDPRSSGP